MHIVTFKYRNPVLVSFIKTGRIKSNLVSIRFDSTLLVFFLFSAVSGVVVAVLYDRPNQPPTSDYSCFRNRAVTLRLPSVQKAFSLQP